MVFYPKKKGGASMEARGNTSGEYLNRGILTGDRILEVLFYIIGGGILSFYTLVLLGVLVGDSVELLMGLGIVAAGALPGVLLVALAVRKRRNRGRAVRLDQYFRQDADGIVLMSKAASVMGACSEEQAAKWVNRLIEKKYLENCTVEQGGRARILLSGHHKQGSASRAARCSGCGAPVELRRGFVTECPYCGTRLEG